MAWSISEAGEKVIDLLKAQGITLDANTDRRLRSRRYFELFGYNCMVANVMSPSTFRVRVNTDWFRYPHSDKSKPRLRTAAITGFDFQLIPTNRVLYSLYYQSLRDYAFQLERDKETWFKEPWWGISVDEGNGTFIWKGGNKISFPLNRLSSPHDLSLHVKDYALSRKQF